jgi:PleD family two-component response regulator
MFAIVELDVYRQTFGAKAADSCQRMIGAQITRTLRRAGDLCAKYDDSTLVAAVLGQTPDEIRHLSDQIAGNVRRLGLHNPRAKAGRHITVNVAVIGCPPGASDDADSVIARALVEVCGSDDVRTVLA